MPRRLKLSPVQRDIMVTLREAGAESMETLIATIKPAAQAEFDREVDGLVELGLAKREDSSIDEGSIELVLTDAGWVAMDK